MTSEDFKEHSHGNVREDIAASALEEMGFTVSFCIWDDPDVIWQDYDVVIIRNTWDYHLKIDAFTQWVKRIAGQGVRILNPPDVILANSHKSYLKALVNKGVPVPPTVFITQRQSSFPTLVDILEENGWTEAVVKPAVSASSYKTTHVNNLQQAGQHQNELETLLKERDVMVQWFVPSIQRCGEWSLIFFNRKFSHAVLKMPTTDDFRCLDVQVGYYQEGIIKKHPSAQVMRVAELALSLIQGQLLFSRVDLMEDNGKVWLMEVELIEPQLFFDCYSDTVANFAKAFKEII